MSVCNKNGSIPLLDTWTFCTLHRGESKQMAIDNIGKHETPRCKNTEQFSRLVECRMTGVRISDCCHCERAPLLGILCSPGNLKNCSSHSHICAVQQQKSCLLSKPHCQSSQISDLPCNLNARSDGTVGLDCIGTYMRSASSITFLPQ